MTQMPAPSTDINVLPEVAPAAQIAAKATNFIRRQLDPNAQKIAQQWAKLLIPDDPTNPPSYITLADEDLDKLPKNAWNLMNGVSLAKMDEIDRLNKKINDDFKMFNIDDLSPTAKRIFIFFRETAKMVANRVRRVLNNFETKSGELEKNAATAIRMRNEFVEMEKRADAIGKETRESRYIVRIAAEACKIYLETHGAEQQDLMIAEVEKQQAIAKEKGYELDEKWTEDLSAFKNYLTLVETYMLDMENAAQTAALTYAGFDAMETNTRLIAQGLHNQAKVTIPNWIRMFALRYQAYIGNKAIQYLSEQDERNVKVLTASAESIGMIFDNIATMLRRGQYSQEAMKFLNDTLTTGIEKTIVATDEFRKAHIVTSESLATMQEQLGEVRLKYGKQK